MNFIMNTTDPNTHSLHHGKEFHKKHQEVKQLKHKDKHKGKKLEGFRGNQQDNAFYAKTDSVKEQSHQLLNKNSDIQHQVQNIKALENQYAELAKQYNTVKEQLMTVTKNFANNSSAATNVYVTKVVNNPTATYQGAFIAGPNTMTASNSGGTSFNACLETALKEDNDYFGLQSGQCLISNNLTTATNLGQAYSSCNKSTDGNIYGGSGVNSVYQVPDATYVATFNDSPNRAMPFSNGGRQVDDYNSCRAQAVKGGYKFFGLQNGSMNGNAQCVVSNDYNQSTAQGTTTNSFVAKDGKTYGGGWANAVYQVNSSTPTYVGCFNDNAKKPAMDVVNGGAATYSVDSCLEEAQKAGSKYFAVQGTQPGKSKCYISNNLTAVKQYGQATPEFKGSDGHLYGNSGINAIYKVDQTNGNPSVVGKLGYVDENGTLSAYPSSMNNKGTIINNNPSCPTNVKNIDSIQWSSYPSSGTSMSPASVCGLAAAKEKDDRQLKSIESQMRGIANQIVQSTYTLQSYNSDLLKQMGVDKISLDDNLKNYKETNDQFSKYKKNYINNTNGLLDDTQVMVNQESYSYMLWTMAAVTVVIVVLFTVK